MSNDDNMIKKAFEALNQEGIPTQSQKDTMLNYIIATEENNKNSIYSKLIGCILNCPWKFAFGVATVQAILFTIIFGTKYTNLLLRLF